MMFGFCCVKGHRRLNQMIILLVLNQILLSCWLQHSDRIL